MRFSLAPIDALLLLMVIIWGSNYTVIKASLREIPPLAFNALRLVLASAVFVAVIAIVQRAAARSRGFPTGRSRGAVASIFFTNAPLTSRDWAALVGLGIVGHFLYQLCFLGGLARTTVANSALILGASPVAVALVTAAVGQERVSRLHWAGIGLSGVGVYLVAGRGASLSSISARGDALIVLSVWCWAVYTVGARSLMTRHSPLFVTGVSMTIGTLLYLPVAASELRRVHWDDVSPAVWAAVGFSAVFALGVGYLIWYAAVQQIGNTRTSVYSNLVPLVGIAIAVLWLGEPVGATTLAGAGCILSGAALTRVGRSRLAIPAEQ